MTESILPPTAPAAPAAPAAAPKAKKATPRLDKTAAYGYITGRYAECPKARISQGGHFFTLTGKHVGSVPTQTTQDD